MADRHPAPGPGPVLPSAKSNGRPAFLQKLHNHAPNSTQVIGFLTLATSGGILLLLTGLALTATILALIIVTPLIILMSPIWVPVGTFVFVAILGFLAVCTFSIATIAGFSWLYKYTRGSHPPGYDCFDYARRRIAKTGCHMKDYAKKYGWHLQSKVKGAAPSA